MSPFEMLMLICFGASWPFSIAKTYRMKTSAGKSLGFLALVLVGYLSGILHKLIYNPDWVIIFYLANAVMVATDLMLSCKYRRS